MSSQNIPGEAVLRDAPGLQDGRYVFLGRLGEGGMAGVYRVWDTRLKVYRAIKVLFPKFAKKRKLRSRFEGEAQTMARLEHPNLVRVYDVGTSYKLPYLVMELVPGGTLIDWLMDHGAMPPRMATECTMSLCRGTMHAHKLGVVHRDIKPHNVLISNQGMCKLTDFGIAQIEDQGMTKTGSVMGTLGYMAPEQRNDAKNVDVRSDIYAIGATFWKLLTNRTVRDMFMAEEHIEMLEGVPELLRPIITRCVKYNRDDRYADVQSLMTDLEKALQKLGLDQEGASLIRATPYEPAQLTTDIEPFTEIGMLFGTMDEDTGPEVQAAGFRFGHDPGQATDPGLYAGQAEEDARDPVTDALPYFMPPTPAGASRSEGLPSYLDPEVEEEQPSRDNSYISGVESTASRAQPQTQGTTDEQPSYLSVDEPAKSKPAPNRSKASAQPIGKAKPAPAVATQQSGGTNLQPLLLVASGLLMMVLFVVLFFGYSVYAISGLEADTRAAWKEYCTHVEDDVGVVSELKNDRVEEAGLAESRYFDARPDNAPLTASAANVQKEAAFVDALRSLTKHPSVSDDERRRLTAIIDGHDQWRRSRTAEMERKDGVVGSMIQAVFGD